MSAAAVVILRVKRVFAFLRNKKAISPATALPIRDVPYSDKWYFSRLVRRGAVQLEGEKCYLDEVKAEQYLRGFRVRALVFTVSVLLAFAIYMIATRMN
jgi:hypothetical protein